MGILSKWVAKMVDRERNNELNDCKAMDQPSHDNEWGRPLNITVTNVIGGKIVSFRSYNRQTNRSQNTTYIIHLDEVFDESLAKLIKLEEVKM